MTTSGGTDRSGSDRDLRGPSDVDAEQMLTLGDGGATAWRRPPRDSRVPRPPKVSAGVEATVAAAAALLGLPGLGQLQRQALVGSGTIFVVGVVLSVAAAFAVAAALHRWLGGGRRRDAGAVGLVAALLAGTAWGAVAMSGSWGLWQYLPPRIVLWAAALAGVVLAVRTRGVGARLVGSFAGVTTAIAVTSALQTGWPLLTSYLFPTPVSLTAPLGETAEATPSVDGPAREEDLAGPTFGDLCHPDELEVDTTVPVPGGNDVATTLTATNVGARECRVEGWPSLHLLSDGEDLFVNVHTRQSQPGGEHVEAVEVWLEPGASARTQVWWPSWGAAADLDAAQELRIGVGGSTEVVELPPPARWDLVRSAEAYVTPWQPADTG